MADDDPYALDDPGQRLIKPAVQPEKVATGGFPLPPAATKPPQAGQFSNNNQGFLDWATQEYGPDKTRGSGFVDERAGGGFEKMLGDYGAATGNTAKFEGGPSGDRADFGQGIQDARTSGGQIWNAAGGGGGSAANEGGGGAATGGAAPTPGPPAPPPTGYVPPVRPPLTDSATGQPPASATPATLGDWTGTTPGQGTDLYNTLMARAGQGLNVDPSDPIIRNQSDAHRAQLERGRTRYLQEVAERGGANANISSESRASAEQVGTGAADFESVLMGQERNARRQEIQQALDGAAGVLSSEQQQGLQAELAQMSETGGTGRFNAGMAADESRFGRGMAQRDYEFDTGVGQRESEFSRNFGQRGLEFGANLTQMERQMLMQDAQFGRSLGQRESEFGRNLGQNAYEFDATDQWRNSPLYG